MNADWIEIKRGDILPQFAGIHVSINPKGFITMNRATHQMLGDPAAFLLLYDRVNNRIGLKPSAKAAPENEKKTTAAAMKQEQILPMRTSCAVLVTNRSPAAGTIDRKTRTARHKGAPGPQFGKSPRGNNSLAWQAI